MRPHQSLPLALLALAACSVPDRTESAGSRAASSVAAGPDTALPEGELGRSVRRGRALLTATVESLPGNVGGGLRCTSCHLDAGLRESAIPLSGVYARFPQYRARTASVSMIEERINDCFRRSLNGRALPWESREMRDIVAYLAFLSRDSAVARDPAAKGLQMLTPLVPDTSRGRTVYGASCVACHGADGQGTPAAPPLWGRRSYNIGASMARLNTAAAFIRHNMPFDRPGTLTDQQAYDVAAYMNAHQRPDFAGKERDWPNGDAPTDVPYATAAKKKRA